ncbi:MAG: hypothetical protein MZW92_74715 [Comamonadaceae bacterium]|nr:hypothetical protein [Comamonadaceae bacterium]
MNTMTIVASRENAWESRCRRPGPTRSTSATSSSAQRTRPYAGGRRLPRRAHARARWPCGTNSSACFREEREEGGARRRRRPRRRR